MAWLVREGGDVLASAEIARGIRERTQGLLGRRDSSEVTGALVLRPCRQVHTFGMRFPIDVAFCDPAGTVLTHSLQAGLPVPAIPTVPVVPKPRVTPHRYRLATVGEGSE